jgi:hypothetical protein
VSYQNPQYGISPSFNVFGEGTFRFVDEENFDWSENNIYVEKLTNEGWKRLSLDEQMRILRLWRKDK